MKTKLTTIALSMASVVWVATQQVNDQGVDTIVPQPDPRSPMEGVHMGAVGVDPITFQVMSLADVSSIDSATLEGLNAPEQRLERASLVLLANDSDQYFKRFPKSREQLSAEERANFEINNPASYSEKLQKEPNR